MLLYFLYILLSPLAWIGLIFFSLFNSKVRDKIINQRASIASAIKKILTYQGDREVIIVHAASAGEYEQIKPLIVKIDREKFFILQTFSSPTIFNLAKEDELFDACCYLPFDFLISSFRFFRSTGATHFINTRHDVWPNSVVCCRLLKIRSVIINANLHSESMKTKPMARGLYRFLYNQLDLIICPSERIKKQFNQIGIKKNIQIISDTRINQIINRSKVNPKNLFNKEILESTNIVFGSVDKRDVEVIVEAMVDVYPKKNVGLKKEKHRVVIVPHECDEESVKEVVDPLEESGFSCTFFKPQMELNNCEVIIVNKTGLLADLYHCSSLAYVGGGFTTGVHNVIEPLVYYNKVCFGPNISLLDEAVDIVELQMGNVVYNSSDLSRLIQNIETDSHSNQLTNKIKEFFMRSDNNVKLMLNEIFNHE